MDGFGTAGDRPMHCFRPTRRNNTEIASRISWHIDDVAQSMRYASSTTILVPNNNNNNDNHGFQMSVGYTGIEYHFLFLFFFNWKFGIRRKKRNIWLAMFSIEESVSFFVLSGVIHWIAFNYDQLHCSVSQCESNQLLLTEFLDIVHFILLAIYFRIFLFYRIE